MTTLQQIEALIDLAAEKTNHRNFVIVGSLSVIGAVMKPPAEMAHSIDVDIYLKHDPNRQKELAEAGQDSKFFTQNGCFADPVSPQLISAPDAWQDRLIPIPFKSGTIAWFMDPNDAAISKCFRGDPKDQSWIAAGVNHGILSIEKIRDGIEKTFHILSGERERALNTLSAIEKLLEDPARLAIRQQFEFALKQGEQLDRSLNLMTNSSDSDEPKR
jgi:hypothetical protein